MGSFELVMTALRGLVSVDWLVFLYLHVRPLETLLCSNFFKQKVHTKPIP